MAARLLVSVLVDDGQPGVVRISLSRSFRMEGSLELIRSAALALALSALPLSAAADDGRWMFPQYSPYRWVTVPCAVGYVCTVDFAAGEVLGDAILSDATHWHVEPLRKSVVPELTIQNNTPGLRPMTLVLGNMQHRYKFIFIATNEDRPTSVVMRYEQPSPSPQPIAARPKPKPKAMSLLEQAIAACRSQHHPMTADADTDRRGRVDKAMRAIRPVLLCHDHDRTYVQLPERDTAETDLPLVFGETSEGLVEIGHPYFDERARLFVLMTTSNIVLQSRDGKRTVQMHLRRADG